MSADCKYTWRVSVIHIHQFFSNCWITGWCLRWKKILRVASWTNHRVRVLRSSSKSCKFNSNVRGILDFRANLLQVRLLKTSVGLLRVRTLKLGIFRNWYIVRTSRQIPNLLADPKSTGQTQQKLKTNFLQHKNFDVNTLAPKQWVSSVSTLSALHPLPYVQKGSEQRQQENKKEIARAQYIHGPPSMWAWVFQFVN